MQTRVTLGVTAVWRINQCEGTAPTSKEQHSPTADQKRHDGMASFEETDMKRADNEQPEVKPEASLTDGPARIELLTIPEAARFLRIGRSAANYLARRFEATGVMRASPASGWVGGFCESRSTLSGRW